MTGNIVMSGTETVDGRDLSVDGAKLDGIAGADVTPTNVSALHQRRWLHHRRLYGCPIRKWSDWCRSSGC